MKLYQILSFVFPLSFLFSGCIIYPELVETGINAPESKRCGDCHIAIYDEWKDSPHARSFINEEFKEMTNEYEFTFCLGCHVPETIFTDGEIKPREVNRTEGVNCNGCHLNDCKLSGPMPARAPHPIEEENLFFRTSELCGKCHAGTYRYWKSLSKTEELKTCQDCHMPQITRKLIQDEPWQKLYPKKEGKRHLFSYAALFDKNKNGKPINLTFKNVTFSDSDGTVKGLLELENKTIPHTIPTGDFGYKEVLVTITLLDLSGSKLAFKEESLFVEMKTALKYKEKRLIPFQFRCNISDFVIKATMKRVSFTREKGIFLAEKSFEHSQS